MASEPEPEKKPAGKVQWKAVAHPRNKMTLGEMEDDKRLSYVRWVIGMGDEEPAETDVEFCEAVKAMAKERKWDNPVKCYVASFMFHAGYGEAFEDKNIEAFVKDDTGDALADMNEDVALTCLAEFGEKIEALKDFATKAKKKPAKATMPD